MLDYHLHLWPHGTRALGPTLDQLAAYCEAAQAQGVTEIAVTEHLFRFRDIEPVVGRFWDDDDNAALRADAERYWGEHCHTDLDTYVEVALAAKDAGLPIVLGMEVDHYPDRMDRVAEFLDGYPFDVLLGSVHWMGAWMFDDIDSTVVLDEWERHPVEAVWDRYTRCLEELAATGAVDVLAHPDLCKVTGERPDVPDEFYDRMAEAAAAAGIAAEVSSAGWRKPCAEAYPAVPLLHRFRKAGVAVTTASDAHTLPDVAFRSADLRALLAEAGYDELRAFRARRPTPIPVAPALGPDDGPGVAATGAPAADGRS